MTTRLVFAGVLALISVAVAVPVQTQGQKKAPAGAKTPWGDPDLQGVWTSDSNSTVPFERPDAFAGKEVLDGRELIQVQQEREQSRARTAPNAGGITGAGPVHWYEHFGAKSIRTSLVVAPADGRIPPMIPSAQQREAARAATRAGRVPRTRGRTAAYGIAVSAGACPMSCSRRSTTTTSRSCRRPAM